MVVRPHMGKTSALVHMLVPVMLPVAGIILSVAASRRGVPATQGVVGGLAVCTLGGLLIVLSKLPRFSAGEMVSFGAKGLPVWAQVCYYFGYPLLLLGAAFAVIAAARLG